MLLLSTRKGLISLEEGADGWRVTDVAFPGVAVEYACRDPRTGVVWAALQHGHWGPKLHKRVDGVWSEVTLPAYPEDAVLPSGKPATLENIWVIQPGGADEPGRVYLGTNPGGLFASDDGERFELVRALWDHPSRLAKRDGPEWMHGWFGGGRDTPGIHSIVVDPRDSAHLYVAISCAGVFESRDHGASWTPRNQGLPTGFLPDDPDVGQDPHRMQACTAQPDVLWQQNHQGVFVSDDGGASWRSVSQEDGPVGFGFPVVAHPTDPDVAWVVPAVSDGQRNAIDGAVCVARTRDRGKSWQILRDGLPAEAAWDLVYRHALDLDGDRLAFGSTTGNAWFSADGGDRWEALGNHFPPIYAVCFA